MAVSAAQAGPARCGLQAFLGFDERSVDSIHLVVQSAGIAEVVPGTIPSPQRSRDGATVYALAPLSWELL